MDESNVLSRRKFLYGSALVAGGATLAACSSGGGGSNSGSGGPPGGSGGKGSATKPLPVPATLNESPTLTAMAKSGKIPALKDRLPAHPYVVPHNWVTKGQYGGTLNIDQFGTNGMGQPPTNAVRNLFYGFSPLRWLNDGANIGPGTCEKWSSNADATEWTLSFRKGLKWSDGVPFTVDDIIFWYEDIALPGFDAQSPPPDLLSAKGNPAKLIKVDDNTLQIAYDSPQPLLPDYLAAWVKGNIGGTNGNGPVWLYPKHYMKQFHPKYNKSVKSGWDAPGGIWELKGDWLRNPACPTLIGYKCKSFNLNTGAVLERNPYYWVVSKNGDQLPYIDTINFTLVQNAQVIKLHIQSGKVDYCHGNANQIDLGDYSTLQKSAAQGNYVIVQWDSGSGTGSMFFLNRDYPNDKYRKLFRDKRFMRAISHGWARQTTQKTLYFETGELTTGTMSPKAMEWRTGTQGPQTYATWRDSAKTTNVQKAKSLLKEIGLADKNGDGFVEFPDGSTLTVEIPYSADMSQTEAAKDDQLVSDMKRIGLRMVRRPIPPQAYNDAWNNGTLMSHTNWEVGDGPNCLVYPQWLAPLENTRWSPLEGAWYQYSGTPKAKQELNVNPWKRHPPRIEPIPGSPTAQLISLYNQTKNQPDQLKRTQLVWQIAKLHVNEGPFFIGCTANYPQLEIHNKDLQNVATHDDLAEHGFYNPWIHPTPAAYDPEIYYWNDPAKHS